MNIASNIPANPKQIYGDKKPRLSLNPLSADLAQWEAMNDGMLKYGEVNWRNKPVEAQTYIDAALRHLRLYEHGENFTRDTNVNNLGAVMACCAILIDAELHGTLIDNRNISPVACDMLHHRGEAMVKHLRELKKKREQEPLSKEASDTLIGYPIGAGEDFTGLEELDLTSAD